MANSKESWLQRCRSSTHPLLPYDLMWEILIRLPAKSLMRFKCVSRLWKSIIQDSSFARDYRGGFRGILICEPSDFRLAFETDFYHLSISDVPDDSTKLQFSHHSTVSHGDRMMRSTVVVNGLVCFYDCNRSYLYNVATRERMELPVSMYQANDCTYHLGFDPVNKLYKLLKLSPDCDIRVMFNGVGILVHKLNCEVLTIGVDSSWRSICPAHLEILTPSACYNGVLYWLERDVVNPRLIAFHLAQEKFQISMSPDGYIPYFGPGLAIVHPIVSGNINKAEIYRSVGGSPGWTKSEIPLPPKDEVGIGYAPVGTLPNGKMFMVENRYWDASLPLSFYLYDPIKGLEQIVVRPSPSYKYISRCTQYHEENIMPLRCLNSFP